jgi:hypothetical protein
VFQGVVLTRAGRPGSIPGMGKDDDPRRRESVRPAAKADKLVERQARQAAALRRNLERRKAQSRGRKVAPPGSRDA